MVAGARSGTRTVHAGQTTTNEAGEYRFEGLSPDTYYVSASAGTWGYSPKQILVDGSGKATKVHDLPTFYPAALSLADAQGVHVEGGQEQAGIDIRIRRAATHSVTGKIALTGPPPSTFSISANVEVGIGWTSESGEILPNGDFVFKELPPGKRQLTLSENGPNGPRTIGETEINLTDQDVTGIVITPFKPAQVRVRVVIEGEEDTPLTTGSVALFPEHWDRTGMGTYYGYPPRNGAYFIDDVPPGKYWISFPYSPGRYLKSVQSGTQTLDPQSIEIGDGATLDLLMIYSKNVASVSGDVEVPPDQPMHSVHLWLICEDLAHECENGRTGIDQSLHFSNDQMRPGKYLAFAAEDDNSDLWKNADFIKLIQPEGVELELHEKDHATIHLKLIPKSETDRLRRQLGI